ncbi:MAG: CAP domain-containing protein [bacterium]
MFSWLKKYLIPYYINDHRPYILRDYGARNVIVILVFCEIFTFLIPIFAHINMTGGMAAVLPAVLSNLTNTERESQSLNTLAVNQFLNKAAELKAQDMATNGYFAHTSPDGKNPWYWLKKVGYKYQYAGENLAINFVDSRDVADAWMQSPTHRANIVKGNYTEMGTGIATGMYEGHETIFVVQLYANPLPTVVSTQNKTTQKEVVVIKENPVVAVEPKSKDILGAEVNDVSIDRVPIVVSPLLVPSFLQEIFASPRNVMNIVMGVIFGLIVVILFFYIFIKMKNQKKDLVTNGLVVLGIIGAIFLANRYLSFSETLVAQNFDYANQNN